MSLIRYNFDSNVGAYQIEIYYTEDRYSPYENWFHSLKDQKTREIVQKRLLRIILGNFGDRKPVGEGVWELRIHFGPGFRIYYAMRKKQIVLLLAAGEKTGQRKDIKTAISCWLICRKENNAD